MNSIRIEFLHIFVQPSDDEKYETRENFDCVIKLYVFRVYCGKKKKVSIAHWQTQKVLSFDENNIFPSNLHAPQLFLFIVDVERKKILNLNLQRIN